MPRPQATYVDVAGSRVAYTVSGEGPLDLLYLTTWLSHIDYRWEHPRYAHWFGTMQSFSRLVMFDRRGSGASDPFPTNTTPTWEDWLDDALAVLDAAGSKRSALVAVADGGPEAILLAATYPERVSALVLVNTTPCFSRSDSFPEGSTPEQIQMITSMMEKTWGDDALVQLAIPSMVGDPEFLAFWARYQRMAMSPRQAGEQARLTVQMDVRGVLSTINVPTLVVQRREVQFPFYKREMGQYLASHIEGATYVEVDGSDVNPAIGNVDEILEAIEEFLTGHRPAGQPDRVLATVMFTDIVGSTEKASEIGDRRWRALLDQHDATVRSAVERNRGRLVKHTGDGILATFEGPNRAIRCGWKLRDEVHQHGIAVRIGVHTGEVERRNGDIGGIAVHVAARVMALAQAEEVLVSSTVKDLVAGSGIEFADRGEHALKGLPEEWRLLAVQRVPD